MAISEEGGSLYQSLPSKYLSLLSSPSESTLLEASTRFLSQPELSSHLFVTACQLYNTISAIELYIKDYQVQNAVLLNAEFVFYKLYEEYYGELGVGCNPFLWHWLQVVLKRSKPEWDPRTELIKALLKRKDKDVQDSTPEQLAKGGWRYHVSTSDFQTRLARMGLWGEIMSDEEARPDIPFKSSSARDNGANVETGKDKHGRRQSVMENDKPCAITETESGKNGATKSSDNVGLPLKPTLMVSEQSVDSDTPPSPTSSCNTSIDEQPEKADAISLLLDRISEMPTRELPHAEQQTIISHLNAHPSDILRSKFPFQPGQFANTVLNNPALAKALVKVGLFKVDSSKEFRDELIHNLSQLPISLPGLELLTSLAVPTATERDVLPDEQLHFLLHNFLSTSLRRLEEHHTSTSISSRVAHRKAIGEKVKLLCLFLRNLITKGIIMSNPPPEIEEKQGDYFYELQELSYKFIWIKEAKKVWELFQAMGSGDGSVDLGALSDVD